MRAHPLVLPAAIVAAAMLAGCGGGGGGAGRQPPVISAASASSARYGESMLVTLAGSELDQTLTLTSPGCRDFVRSTTAPNISGATVAYYTCTVSGVGDLAVTVQGGGITVASVPYTVAQPQVTLLLNNGLGVAGSLVITLDPARAPLTVDNFLAYVKSGFYNGTVFHRNARESDLSTFALQGGGYAAPVTAAAAFPTPKPTRPPVALEVGRGLSNLRYTVAMARTSLPDSATAEFFVNAADNTYLDTAGGGYAVFGNVTTGTAVVDAMVAAPCTLSPVNFNSGFVVSPDCVPEPNIVIANAAQTR